jgi:hypothetical protein
LLGASVANDRGDVTTALPTPDDPAVDDAFYTLFSPAGSHTLASLLEAAGFALRVRLEPAVSVDTHMLEDVERILSLTPEERLLEAANLSRFEAAVKRV